MKLQSDFYKTASCLNIVYRRRGGIHPKCASTSRSMVAREARPRCPWRSPHLTMVHRSAPTPGHADDFRIGLC
jgi:hypothetical protein